ncbi:DUF6438 domain-containing protein [Daejeonella lutea]|nr:hypothetical protein [Daejeonella lutea]
MKRISVLTCICLLITDLVIAQDGRKNIANGFNKLDSVSTAEGVEAIVSQVDKRYVKFRVSTSLNFELDHCKSLGDINQFKAISKADFDKNGYTDLLVVGIVDKIPTILTLMGSSENKISVNILSRWRSRRCSIAKAVTEDEDTFIELKYFRPYSQMPDSAKLIFKFGDFVEYNPKTRRYNVEKIEYKFNDAFALEINTNRKASLKATEYNTLRSDYFNAKYIGRIDVARYEELLSILDYSDFPSLQNQYDIGGSHFSSGILKITYNNGLVKIIVDHGLIGTFALNRIHDKMVAIRTNQEWKLEAPKALIPLPSVSN